MRDPQAVIDNGGDGAALLGGGCLLLDHGGDGDEVVDRQAVGLDIALVIALCGPALGKRRVQRFELGGSIVRELAVEIRQQLLVGSSLT